MEELNSNTGAAQSGITLEVWRGCDSYMGCSQCGDGKPDEGLPVILKRNRTEPFAVSDDGKLSPICVSCVEQQAPEMLATYWQIRGQEMDEEERWRQSRPARKGPELDDDDYSWLDEL